MAGLSSSVSPPSAERKAKKLILNAFVEMCSGHQSPGLWRHPRDESWKFNDVNHWVELAKLLESAKFHGIFIADVLGGYDVFNGNLDAAIRSGAQWPVNEPLAVIPAMAAATKSIGFGVTVSTTYEQPYHLARRLSTIDHLSKGRIGWNIVTGYLDSAARNLGYTEQPQHDKRYEVAEEYLEVMYKLFESSWRDDAVVLDREKGVYTVPDRAGTSKAGKEFAAQHAEGVFVAGHSPSVVAKSIAEIRQLASTKFGRNSKDIKFLSLLCPVLGKTQEEADAKFKEYRSYASVEGALALLCGWTGIDFGKYGDDEELRQVESNAVKSAVDGFAHLAPGVPKWTKWTVAELITIGGLGATPVGTPQHVADVMERWIEEADIDGFNLAYALFPSSFQDIIDLLLPELRARGLFWDEYAVPSGTYRENLYVRKGQHGPLPEHVAASYRWKAGVPQSEHIIPEGKRVS